MSNYSIYHYNRHSHLVEVDIDFSIEYSERIDRLNFEIIKWSQNFKSKMNVGISKFLSTFAETPISLKQYFYYKHNSLLGINCTGLYTISDQDNPLKKSFTALSSKKSVNSKQDQVKYYKDEFVANWAKCQILANAEKAPLFMVFTRIMADYYYDKATYIQACRHEGLLILELPKTLASNKQTKDIITDLLYIRLTVAPTLIISTDNCIVSASSGQDATDVNLVKSLRQLDYVIDLSNEFDNYNKSKMNIKKVIALEVLVRS